jgi:hypothetical protein
MPRHPESGIVFTLAVETVRDAVANSETKKQAYVDSLAARDDVIRDAAKYLPYPRLMEITGLGRETLSRIVNRRK